MLAHWSMVRLPTEPMLPRLADDRIGFLSVTRTDYGTKQYRSVEREYINRWRLEKKNPGAGVSDPVKPIVYYIDPATPEQWKPWIRKAVLDWQPAFEAAGFSQRHHTDGSADRRSRLVAGRRASHGDSLASIDGRRMRSVRTSRIRARVRF